MGWDETPISRHKPGASKMLDGARDTTDCSGEVPRAAAGVIMDAKAISKDKLPSRYVTVGPARAPHRSYLYAMGLSEEEIAQPLVHRYRQCCE